MIKVNFHSGYKGEEKPYSFELDEKIHFIIEVIESKITEEFDTRKRRRVYLVRTEEGEIYELLERNGGWNLRKLTDSHFA